MILVVNSGSSSLKFRLYQTTKNLLEPVAEGIAERIGLDGKLIIKKENQTINLDLAFPDHFAAVNHLVTQLQKLKIIEKIADIQAVGFRVVHGSDQIAQPVVINQKVKKIITEAIKLAPLHNPGALVAIEAFQKATPQACLVACFDTSFHQSLPPLNYLYPVPYKWFSEYQVRKYGFHGISVHYITKKMSEILQKPQSEINLVVCHLGNGASLTAVADGCSLDTTMGFTPLAGVMMGTRSGTIDPSILAYMSQQLGKNIEALITILNKESGLLGLSGISSDMRDIEIAAAQGNKQAQLTFDKYVQTIADYTVEMANRITKPLDAIVFTAGIGENSAKVRAAIAKKSPLLKIAIDSDANLAQYNDWKIISTTNSQIPIYVVRTNEELMIAQETQSLMKNHH